MDNERSTGDGAPDGSTDGQASTDRREGGETPPDEGGEEATGRPTSVGNEEPATSTSPGGEEAEETVGDEATASEQAALKRVRAVSRLLDDAIPIPGTDFRVGLDPILGILPVAGDGVAMLVSLYPIVEAYRLGMSRGALAKMLALVGIDAVVGSVPVLGPVFDAFWKANKWNLRTLEDHLEED